MDDFAQDLITLPGNALNLKFLKGFSKTKKFKKILLIEDDYDMSMILSKSLNKNYNCSVDIANDPFEAINFMLDKYYDLIILDWKLPGLNGTEVLVEVEKGLRFEPAIPIQWDKNKVPVVIFSSSKKSECTPRRTKHFNYAGFVSKVQPLNNIVELFGAYVAS